MELEVQEMREQATVQKDGSVVASGHATPVGPKKTYEFGVANDDVTAAVGGGYVPLWNPDFLQKILGKKGTCARFYFDKRVAVDIRNPEGQTAKVKRQLLHENGFAYLCIPEDFPQDVDRLRKLYSRAVHEYHKHEARHPRPIQYQESMMIDDKGVPKKVKMTAIDIAVGGKIIGGSIDEAIRQQEAEVRAAKSAGKDDMAALEERARVLKAIRRCRAKGQPFRNPFRGNGKRKYNVAYAS